MQDLTTKTLKELKALADASLKSAYERGIYHEGDKRQRQTWIDFLERCANTDIDVSEKVPGEIQAQALTEAAENLLDAEPKFSRITYPQSAQKPIAQTDKIEPKVSQSAIAQTAKNSPGVEPVQEAIEGKIEPAAFRELTFSEAIKVCHSIADALPTKNLKELQTLRQKVLDLTARPGSSRFHGGHSKHKSSWIAEIRRELTYLLEIRAIAFPAPIGLGRAVSPGCVEKSWDIPSVEIQAQALTEAAKSEPKMIQSAIAQTAENSPGVEADQNPILTGIALSDSFLARYSPPQSEVLHYQADTDGQLSIFDPQVESANEPPDPDDYDLMTDFHDAYDRWLVTSQINEALAENNETDVTGVSAEPIGADEIAIGAGLPSECNHCAELHGTGGHNQDEGLGSQKKGRSAFGRKRA